jgi:acetyl esterase/lipase
MASLELPVWDGVPPLWNPADTRPAPRLHLALLPGESLRPLVLVFPGGGYNVHAPHEDLPVRELCNAQGWHAAALHYRTQWPQAPRPLGRGPLEDALQALRLIRANAGKWNVDPARIAVLGFSAGGHLAGSVAVHAPQGLAPRAAVLCYAVLTSDPAHWHAGSFANLCGPDDEAGLRGFHNVPDHVGPATPPTFLWHTAEDGPVPVGNALAYAGACARHGVPFSLHVFPSGRHGLGLAAEEPLASAWPGLCVAWLTRQFAGT